jgi:hypothetical protein
MITFRHYGDFDNTERFLTGAQRLQYHKLLSTYGAEGVRALASATPVDTGLTSRSWSYSTTVSNRKCGITWFNSNIQNGSKIAILIQYGHATRQGGWVQGRDYINPALRPIFDRLADELWREVQAL